MNLYFREVHQQTRKMPSAMVGLLLLSLAVFYAQSAVIENFLPKLKEAKMKCAEQHKVEIEVFKKLWKEHKLPEDDNGKCFMHCIVKELGMIDDSHKFDLEAVQSTVEQKWAEAGDIEKAKGINDKCIAKVNQIEGDNGCNVTYELMTCYVTESQKEGLKPPGHGEAEDD